MSDWSTSLGYARDAAQGASNAVASTVSVPVDAIAWLLRRWGLGNAIGATPVGGSDWMRNVGLTSEPRSQVAGMFGDLAGSLQPTAAAAKVPAAAAGLLMLAKNSPAWLTDEAGRLARMAEQGYTPGYWRGGKSVADGPHYTPDASAAADFGRRAAGDAADVREYAVRLGNSLDFAKTYKPDQLTALRDVLKRDYGSKYADQLLDVPSDYGGAAPGAAIYQITHQLSGGNAADALRAAGFDTINAGQEVVTLHKQGLVRDAKRALFDPKKRSSSDPFAAIGAGAVGLGLLQQSANHE